MMAAVNRPRPLRGGMLMLLAVMSTSLPGLTVAMERKEQRAVVQPTRDPDAELATAQEDVRRSEELVLSRRRAGGGPLREAQEALIAARERLSSLAAEMSDRGLRNERRQFIEQQRREREREEAKGTETDRYFADLRREADEQHRQAKERREAERQRGSEESMAWMQRFQEGARQRHAAEEAEQGRQAEEFRREKAKPQNVLIRTYRDYVQVKRCHDSLVGKTFVYIDDRELTTAQGQVKDVEVQLLRADPGVDSDGAWRSAQEPDPTALLLSNGGEDDVEAGVLSQRGQEYCRGALLAVRERYVRLNPEAGIVKKDF